MIILTLCYRENYEGEIDNKWQILCALQRFPLEYLWLSRKQNDCLEKVTFSVGGKWMEAVDKCRKIHIDFIRLRNSARSENIRIENCQFLIRFNSINIIEDN